MIIYFDNCAIQRPLDNRSNLRVRVEAEAVIALLELIEDGSLMMVSSDVLFYELSKTPDPERVSYGMKFLSLGNTTLSLNKQTVSMAKFFVSKGLKPVDALHLAIASENNIDYFCTCDDRFIKRSKEISLIKTRVLLPTELLNQALKWIRK